MPPEKYNVYVRKTTNDVARTESVAPDVNIDFDANGEVIGVEILSATDVKGDPIGEPQ